MAWSGDIYIENSVGLPKGLQFVTPREGGLLWTDNMVMPLGAQHPVDAMTLMDFVYQPRIAATIAEWVAYITPVEVARDVILQDADAAKTPQPRRRFVRSPTAPSCSCRSRRPRPCTATGSSRPTKSSRAGMRRSVGS